MQEGRESLPPLSSPVTPTVRQTSTAIPQDARSDGEDHERTRDRGYRIRPALGSAYAAALARRSPLITHRPALVPGE